MLFIYLIEGNAEHGEPVRRILGRMRERGDTLCTSAFAYGEVLTGAFKNGDSGLVETIREHFRHGEIELLTFTPDMAERFAEIRAKHRLSGIDAIHLATAAHARVDLFLTNDRRLQRLMIPGISFIAGLDGTVF